VSFFSPEASEIARKRTRILAAISGMRPKQWTKNVFVLAALVFAQRIGDPVSVRHALLAFAVFCVLSSAVYLINDVADREADRLHPKKRLRPVASGDLSPRAACLAALVLVLVGFASAWFLGLAFTSVACGYLLLNVAYSFGLKDVVILDVMMVSAGFLLRAWAGALAVDVEMSRWLVLCTGLIALFLGFVKRRQEIVSLGGVSAQRPILREYSLPFLDQMIGVVTASTLLAYSLYAFSPEVAEKLGTRHLGLTIPFVLFGIFRYLYLVHQRGEGENPAALVVSDPPLVLNVVLWAAAVLFVLYAWR
jgi:4-hydroxybenzoate polyprenyltransferase